MNLKFIIIYFTLLVGVTFIEGKRLFGIQRKTSRQPPAVTKSTYNPSSNAHSYSNQEAYKPVQNSPNIGWNAPKQGGGHVESPPAYPISPNYAGSNYGNAPGAHYGQATGMQYPQHSYGNQMPPSYGNPYHSAAASPGHYYTPQGNLPAGATYIPAGAALPPGATYYSSPPQQSSGLGFGSGLAAGALGGAILGHVLTPTNTKVIEQTPNAANDPNNSGDRITIINVQQPNNVTEGNTTATIPNDMQNTAAPLAPMLTPELNATQPATDGSEQRQPPPPNGGIICVPVRVMEADPNEPSKQIEVEKIACYPAPQTTGDATNNTVAAAGGEPIRDNNTNLQPLQLSPTSNTLLPEQLPIHNAPSQASTSLYKYCNVIFTSILMYILAYTIN